ncbi:MAG: hypothetical protein KVP17_001895 [Porospora cf. gigantea B]|uniref:uncharacterized protein n=2 Tax=Porospora cf. gigantea B TaxID=2853592 RepID=UPI003571BD0C|nr:MAG: hypothetical protein KVP17_001895 [Porospora cf. gigantea B]
MVRMCVKKDTGEVFAVKVMAKNPSRGGNQVQSSSVDFTVMFRNEVKILERMDHPNVVRHYDVFQDKHYLYALIEKCDGGELFLQVVKQKKFTESDASTLCYQMLQAIDYVHKMQIVHRDIKAENFLFADSFLDADADFSRVRLVLIDFGMSIRLTDDRFLKQLCGSPHYVAPELVGRRYRFEVDLWALGVVIYLMLYGRYPFEGKGHKEIVHKILNEEPDYQRGGNPPSNIAIDFMQQLLKKEPSERMTAVQALRHNWLSPALKKDLSTFTVEDDVKLAALRKASLERLTLRSESAASAL